MFKPGTILNQRYKVLRQLEDGGFSLIFEVKDIHQRNLKNSFGLRSSQSIKILKVLNYSGYQKQDAEFLFRREISLLKRLDHPQIAKHIDDFDYVEDRRLIPCLVLEKVPGQTLETWLQQHGTISEEVALDWLGQCANVLDYLHNEQRIIHLDIKPSNLILKPSGELVFIDFGIARLISQTLFADLLDEEGHKVGTAWYMAPEQSQGKPVTQSDIYALGRLIIQALANLPEEQIPQDDEGEWQWDAIALTLSPETRALLDGMTNRYVRDRLSNIQEIAHKIESIQTTYFAEEVTLSSRLRNFIRWNVLPSAIITGLIMLLRVIGLLEPFELFTYDLMIRMRPDIDGPDPNIVIIRITGTTTDAQLSDVRYQRQLDPDMPEQVSMSDKTLKMLLDKIQPHQPSVIGLDIFNRSFEDIPEHKNIIGICTLGNLNKDDFRESPPDFLPINQVGFVDLDYDRWFDTVRRHQIIRQPREYCPTSKSFAYQIAWEHTKNQRLPIKNTLDQHTVSITDNPRILPYNFFYTRYNHWEYQTLINYRTYREVAQTYSFQEIMKEKSYQELNDIFQGKIVLIGSEAFGDFHNTPFGVLSGVALQAHKISHLLDVAMGRRDNLKYLSLFHAALWIFSWSLGISLLKTKQNRVIYIIIFTLSIFFFGIGALMSNWILPVIPILMLIIFFPTLERSSSKVRK